MASLNAGKACRRRISLAPVYRVLRRIHGQTGRRAPQSVQLCRAQRKVEYAEVFDAKFPIIYHTVFDVCILEEWCRAEGSQGADYQLKTAEEIRQKFRDEGVKYVYVDWLEILRYRLPGSYGYTDFVTPQIFDRLQKLRQGIPYYRILRIVSLTFYLFF